MHYACGHSFFQYLFTATSHSALLTAQTDEQFNAYVLNNPKPVVAKFAGIWCSVCQEAKEPFAQIAQEKEFEHIDFVQIDIDQLAAISDQYDIQAVPTIIFFQGGQKKFQQIGVKEMDKFKEKLRADISNIFGKDFQKQLPDGTLKQAATQKGFFGNMVASFKSACGSMAGAVSSLWNSLVS